MFGSLDHAESALIWHDTYIIRFRAGGVNVDFSYSPSLNDETFHSIMIVQESGGTVKLYINNGEAATATSTEDFEFSMLGGNNNTPKNVNPNFIKQIILYDYALTLADRNALYNNYISPLI